MPPPCADSKHSSYNPSHPPRRTHQHWPVQNGFEKMPFGGDRLGGETRRPKSLRGDNQSLRHGAKTLALESILAGCGPYYLKFTDVSIVSSIQRIRKTQNRGKLNSRLLLIGQ